MRITDFNTLDTEFSNRYFGSTMEATIVKTSKEVGVNMVGVYIPRLMMGIKVDAGVTDIKKSVPSSNCINKKNSKIGDSTITFKNYIELPILTSWNISTPILNLGDIVMVGMIDQDPKTMFIYPMSIGNDKGKDVDTVYFYAPASGSRFGDQLDKNNSYFLKLDSNNKEINLHLSDANGEKLPLDITMDGAAGSIAITDSERTIAMTKTADMVYLETKAGASFAMKGRDIDIDCDNFNLNAKAAIVYKTTKMDGDAKVVNTKYKSHTAKWDKFDIKGTKYKYDWTTMGGKTNKWKHDSPKNTITGILAVQDWISAGGGVAFNGGKTSPPLPTNPQITSAGKATFNGAMSDSAVLGKPLTIVLTQMCINLDALGTMFGIPPTTPTFQSNKALMLSKTCKG